MSMGYLNDISHGRLDIQVDSKTLKRKDETGGLPSLSTDCITSAGALVPVWRVPLSSFIEVRIRVSFQKIVTSSPVFFLIWSTNDIYCNTYSIIYRRREN